jgi:hypothetical protein
MMQEKPVLESLLTRVSYRNQTLPVGWSLLFSEPNLFNLFTCDLS